MSVLSALLLALALVGIGSRLLMVGFLAAASASVNNRHSAKWAWTVVNLFAILLIVSGMVIGILWGP